MSPYFNKSFFEFFPLFFFRLFKLITGSLSLKDLASDEIQIFVLSLICIASALVGALLVLKKMTMLANSLSHTILLGIVIAYLLLASSSDGLVMNFKVLIIAALATGILTTLFTQFLHQTVKLQEDASIGLVFTSFFAIGIVLVTLYTRNAHIGVEIVMGNADALHFNDLKIAFWVTFTNFVFVTAFFKEWKLICFDSAFAASIGFRRGIFNYLLMLLTSFTAISAFRSVGVILFLAFLVGLPLTARLITDNLRKLLIYGTFIGVICSCLSVALARHLLTVYQMPLSTAGLTVTGIGVIFLITLCSKYLKQRWHLFSTRS